MRLLCGFYSAVFDLRWLQPWSGRNDPGGMDVTFSFCLRCIWRMYIYNNTMLLWKNCDGWKDENYLYFYRAFFIAHSYQLGLIVINNAYKLYSFSTFFSLLHPRYPSQWGLHILLSGVVPPHPPNPPHWDPLQTQVTFVLQPLFSF